jgi:hypothetical protein
VTEQRYKAVLAVMGDGRTVGEVAREWAVCRQTMHRWLARYEAGRRQDDRSNFWSIVDNTIPGVPPPPWSALDENLGAGRPHVDHERDGIDRR